MPSSKPSRRRLGREALRAWYAPRRDAYPWRGSHDPYAIWVSEVMLQQTQASRVVPAFGSFLRRFPTVRALAAAARGDVVAEWGGLGYNRRAVRLSEAARAIVRDHGGRIPRDPVDAARAPRRRSVHGRGGGLAGVRRAGRGRRHQRAARRVAGASGGRRSRGAREGACGRSPTRGWIETIPSTWNQALMDLGREVCRPEPRCDVCPLAARLPVPPRRGGRALAGRGGRGPFEGSSRQVRGAVVNGRLRSHPSLTPRGSPRRPGSRSIVSMRRSATLAVDGLVEVERGGCGWRQ